MAERFFIKIDFGDGMKRLAAALREIADRVQKDDLERTLLRVAEPIAQDMAQRAPKLTGKGAASIKARVYTNREHPNDASVAIGPDQKHFYLRYPEFGTFREPAQAFMRGAWDAAQSSLPARMAESLSQLIAEKGGAGGR
jgi:HK97 gp10 family phage protein